MNSSSKDSYEGRDGNNNNNNIMMSKEAIADVSYSIGFSLAILLVLIIMSYISYKCNRYTSSSSSSSSSANNNVVIATHRNSIFNVTTIGDESEYDELVGIHKGGLDESTLVNYPKFMYSQLKKGDSSSSIVSSGCSICLGDYKENHMLRILPDCGHLFHVKCIDPWLKLHPSCPICRSTPLPTPTATPLAG